MTNADYLRAPQRSYNQFRGLGNSLNNLQQVFPSAVFVEYFYPGFDKKYEGMDWSCLGKEGNRVFGQTIAYFSNPQIFKLAVHRLFSAVYR